MIQVGISNKRGGRTDYSIHRQLDLGGIMEGCILEIVFSSCLCGGGLSALKIQQHAQIRAATKGILQGDYRPVSTCSGHCHFCDLEKFLFNSRLIGKHWGKD